MIFPRVLVMGLLVGSFLPGSTQSLQVIPMSRIPDHAIYDAFFFRVHWLDQQADGLTAKGRDGNVVRSRIRRQAVLNTQEETALKGIVADWFAAKSALVKAERAARASGSTEQVRQLLEQRKQNSINHVQQLRSAFGTFRFQLFDSFVRATSTVKGYWFSPQSR